MQGVKAGRVMSESGGALGAFLRERRSLASLSLREMARLANISNAYLSQIERGLHAPSIRVLRAVADVARGPPSDDVERALKRDPRLTAPHKQALLAVYRSYVLPDER